MKNTLLFLVEGKRAEPAFIRNIGSLFFDNKSNNIIVTPQQGTIYSLYAELAADEDVDVFALIFEKFENQMNNGDEKIEKSNVSELHLFFDYDGHDSAATVEKIEAMLRKFDNETENGKPYISYPMLEANRHISKNSDEINILYNIDEGAEYKKFVNENSHNWCQHPHKFRKSEWREIIEKHLFRANCLVNDRNHRPDATEIATLSQYNIFRKQLEKHINTNKQVAALGGIPFFLGEYFGFDELINIVSEGIVVE